MPSYPTSVKSFTTKNAGDSILAAHVNDIQDEVNAIEAGLLNATAPLNSSNSTVANLVVTNALQVSSNSTFAQRPVMPPPNVALVYLDSTGALGSSASSTLAWTAESFVSNSSMHSTGTNPERLIPQTTGLYQVTCQVGFNAASSGVHQIVLDDSTGQFALSRAATDGEAHNAHVIGFKRFDVLGGYCVCRLTLPVSTLSLSSGISQTWASMVKL